MTHLVYRRTVTVSLCRRCAGLFPPPVSRITVPPYGCAFSAWRIPRTNIPPFDCVFRGLIATLAPLLVRWIMRAAGAVNFAHSAAVPWPLKYPIRNRGKDEIIAARCRA